MHGGDIYGKKIELDYSVNLNPCPCPEEIQSAIKRGISMSDRYPDIMQRTFRERVSETFEDISPENIWGGNGASELIMAVVNMYAPKKALVMAPDFSGYTHALRSVRGCEADPYYLPEKNGYVPEKDIHKKIPGNELFIFSNPNNPTGRCFGPEILKNILDRCRETDTILVADESFLCLTEGGESMTRYVREYKNLFVIGSYTKVFSIPGIRAGYIVSDEENISALQKYLPEWNMSGIAQEVGAECGRILKDGEFLTRSLSVIKEERQFLTERLKGSGYDPFPSDTCYILFKAGCTDLYERLLKESVLIRDCSDYTGLTPGYYRIGIRSHEDNEKLAGIMDKYISDRDDPRL